MIIANPIYFLVKTIDLMYDFLNFNFENFLFTGKKTISIVRNFVSDTCKRKKKSYSFYIINNYITC